MTRILIVEDEAQIASFVQKGLANAGYESTIVADGGAAVEAILSGSFALALLDVGLPTLDGFEVLRFVRAKGSRVPVIMLTARTSTHDTVEGLDAGANDYVPKPFRVDELLARVRSRLRETSSVPSTTLIRGEVSLDPLTRHVVAHGRELDLSAREFALAEYFLRNAGRVLSREQLLSDVWGLEFDPGSNVVDVYVRYLRNKFGASHIATVRGTGYRWN